MTRELHLNALYTLNAQMSKLLPSSAQLNLSEISKTVNNAISSHPHVLSTFKSLANLPDQLIDDLIDEIFRMLDAEFHIAGTAGGDLAKSLLKGFAHEYIKDEKRSLDEFISQFESKFSEVISITQALLDDDILESLSDFEPSKLISKATNQIIKSIGGFSSFDLKNISGEVTSGIISDFVNNTNNQNLKSIMSSAKSVIGKNFDITGLKNILTSGIQNLSNNPIEFITHWPEFAKSLDSLIDPHNIGQMKDSISYKTSDNIMKQLQYEYEKAVKEKRRDDVLKNIDKGFCDPSFEFPPKTGEISPLNSTLHVLKTIASNTPPWTSASGMTICHPIPSKGSRYPYNSKTISDSGHISEIDDTPGNERIYSEHKSGTSSEINSVGNKVDKIVGDSYTIIQKNGYVYIEGECDIVSSGVLNVKTQNALNFLVHADAKFKIHGNAEWDIGQNLTFNVSKDFIVNAEDIICHSHKSTQFKTDDSFIVDSNNKISLLANKDVILSGLNISQNAKVSNVLESGKTTSIKSNELHISSNKIALTSSGTLDLKGSTTNVESSGTMNIKAGGQLNMDGSVSFWQSGKAGSASSSTTLSTKSPEKLLYQFPEFILEEAYISSPFVENTKIVNQFEVSLD